MTVQDRSMPDALGHFGPYGGRFVPETLMSALEELEVAYADSKESSDFQSRLADYNTHYSRPGRRPFTSPATSLSGSEALAST